MQQPIIGIDLGTTNSVVSVLEGKLPITILIDHAKLLPSVVSLTDEGFIVGQTAKNILILEPEKTVTSIKRKIGQDISIQLGDKEMRPEEITAIILQKIKETVAEYLKLNAQEPMRVVITVPAYFTEQQRAATSEAAKLAGLEVVRIINEPTAAALAYGMSSLDEATYAIYDFGGGTFDISIVESNDGLIEVLATKGDNELGGDDLDHLLMKHILQEFKTKNNLKAIKLTRKEEARLWRIAEQTKIKLSSESEVEISESFFFKHKNVNLHLDLKISRAVFEKLINQHIDKTIDLLEEAIKDANLKNQEVDGVVLVGGSSRIPIIKSSIEKRLSIDTNLIHLPDEAVSHGATLQGAIIDNKDIDTVLVDITPHSLGVAVIDAIYEEKIMELIATQSEKTNIKEQARENMGTGVLVKKNTPIPTRKSEVFFSAVPFQKEYEIKVCQGEASRYLDNKEIGVFYLKVKNPVEDGDIEVIFDLDINGLLKVSAKEINTGEIVLAEFQSSRGRKVQSSNITKENSLKKEGDKGENTILTRAENLLEETKRLSSEDKNDLKELIQQFKSYQQSENHHALKETETELLDLLYFLESNED